MTNNGLSLKERLMAPTSNFFKVLRNVGLSLTAISAAVITAPITLPVMIITVAGYLTVAGAVMATVAQSTVVGE